MSVYRNLSSKELEVLKYYKSTGYSTINGFILKNPVQIDSLTDKEYNDHQQALKICISDT